MLSDSDDDEEEALLLCSLLENQIVHKRKRWVLERNQQRNIKGHFKTLMPELLGDEQKFYTYFRMSIKSFYNILRLIEGDIRKQNTNFRLSICPEQRLALTLRFFTSQQSFRSLSNEFMVGSSTVSTIIREVCEAICRKLAPSCMPYPTEEQWEVSAKGFKGKFPNCIGCIDMRRVIFKAALKFTKKRALKKYKYLEQFSLVLLTIVSSDYRFISVDVGTYGTNSDKDIFKESFIGTNLENGRFNLPPPKAIIKENEVIPIVPQFLVGDESFTSKEYLLRPFSDRQVKQDVKKQLFNDKVESVREVVDITYAKFLQQWPMYRRPFDISLESAKTVVVTTFILYNYLLDAEKDSDNLRRLLDDSGESEAFLCNFMKKTGQSTHNAFNLRNLFVEYFNST